MRELPILFSGPMVQAINEGRKTVTRRVMKQQPTEVGFCNQCGSRCGAGGCCNKGRDVVWTWPAPACGFVAVSLLVCNRLQGHTGEHYSSNPSEALTTAPPVCPYGQPGDLLYVRETFCIETNFGLDDEVGYPPPFDDGRPILWQEDDEMGRWWEQCHYRAIDPKPELVDESTDRMLGWKPSIHMPKWAARIWLEITSIRVERVQEITEADAIAEGGPMGLQPFETLWDILNAKRGYSWESNPWVWVVGFRRAERPS